VANLADLDFSFYQLSPSAQITIDIRNPTLSSNLRNSIPTRNQLSSHKPPFSLRSVPISNKRKLTSKDPSPIDPTQYLSQLLKILHPSFLPQILHRRRRNMLIRTSRNVHHCRCYNINIDVMTLSIKGIGYIYDHACDCIESDFNCLAIAGVFVMMGLYERRLVEFAECPY
jgi:hypothetical protein